jgi:hypothetical protein
MVEIIKIIYSEIINKEVRDEKNIKLKRIIE